MNSMDAVLDQAADLDQFISNQQLIDRYYEAFCDEYRGRSTPRETFDYVLGQLTDLIQKIPELKTRLWRRIEPNWDWELKVVGGFGRDDGGPLWIAHRESWSRRLEQECSAVFPLGNEPARIRAMTEVLSRANDECRAVEEFLADLPRETAADVEHWKETKQSFYKKLRASKELGAIAAFFIYRHLNLKTAPRDLLISHDGDLILEQLRVLREFPALVPEPALSEISRPVLSLIKDRIAPLREWLERLDLFPRRRRLDGSLDPSSKTVTYRFETVRRAFHGVFVGIATGDCLSGGYNGLATITPNRWAVPALEDVVLIHVRSNGKYGGSLQLIPIHHAKGTWVNVEIFCSAMGKKVLLPAASQSSIQSYPLFSLWLHESCRRKPEAWRGFVMGESPAFDNSKACRVVRSFSTYRLGLKVDKAEKFALRDPLASLIPKIAPPGTLGPQYARGLRADNVSEKLPDMLYDASVWNAGTLVELFDVFGAESS